MSSFLLAFVLFVSSIYAMSSQDPFNIIVGLVMLAVSGACFGEKEY